MAVDDDTHRLAVLDRLYSGDASRRPLETWHLLDAEVSFAEGGVQDPRTAALLHTPQRWLNGTSPRARCCGDGRKVLCCSVIGSAHVTVAPTTSAWSPASSSHACAEFDGCLCTPRFLRTMLHCTSALRCARQGG